MRGGKNAGPDTVCFFQLSDFFGRLSFMNMISLSIMSRRHKIGALLHRPVEKAAELDVFIAHDIRIRRPSRSVLRDHIVDNMLFIFSLSFLVNCILSLTIAQFPLLPKGDIAYWQIGDEIDHQSSCGLTKHLAATPSASGLGSLLLKDLS